MGKKSFFQNKVSATSGKKIVVEQPFQCVFECVEVFLAGTEKLRLRRRVKTHKSGKNTGFFILGGEMIESGNLTQEQFTQETNILRTQFEMKVTRNI